MLLATGSLGQPRDVPRLFGFVSAYAAPHPGMLGAVEIVAGPQWPRSSVIDVESKCQVSALGPGWFHHGCGQLPASGVGGRHTPSRQTFETSEGTQSPATHVEPGLQDRSRHARSSAMGTVSGE